MLRRDRVWENVIEFIIFSTMKFCGSMPPPHDNPSFLATEIVGCSLLPVVVDYTAACHILYILLLFSNLVVAIKTIYCMLH